MRNKVAVFASGNGTNAEKLFEHFKKHPVIEISLLMCNNPEAGVIKKAKDKGIPSVLFTKNDLYDSNRVLKTLKENEIDWIALAGFLLLLPSNIVTKYPNKIVNLHPALLPKYGGKGMYGINVHQAVLDGKEEESGITIHLVNEEYDKGKIIFQATCLIDKGDTPDSLAAKIHKLEYEHFPPTLEGIILRKDVPT